VTSPELKTVELAGRDGLVLAADVVGDPSAPPVVLFHGGGQTRHAWGTTLGVLGQHWHAFSVDLRGHGDSAWAPDGDYGLDAFADDVTAVARSFDTPPVLVGASLGGISSLTAVAEAPADQPLARALVLVDIAPRIERQGVERIGDFMTSHLDGFDSLDEVADLIQAYNPHRPRPTNLEGLKKNLRQRADGRWAWHWDPRFVSGKFGSPDETRSSLTDENRLERAARSLNIPTLLVRGRMSDLLSEEGAQELLAMVPHAELADVAGAGHMVAGDKNDLFNDAIVSFLQRLPS
jgi:pimeloyl-ACP methyl ester carboxylesterase